MLKISTRIAKSIGISSEPPIIEATSTKVPSNETLTYLYECDNEFSSEISTRILKDITLTAREDFMKAPAGFRKEDKGGSNDRQMNPPSTLLFHLFSSSDSLL